MSCLYYLLTLQFILYIIYTKINIYIFERHLKYFTDGVYNQTIWNILSSMNIFLALLSKATFFFLIQKLSGFSFYLEQWIDPQREPFSWDT